MLKHLDGQTFRAPIVGVLDGRICFENGRHRARVARRQGLKVIPVIVDKDNVAAVRELLARFQKAPQRSRLAGRGDRRCRRSDGPQGPQRSVPTMPWPFPAARSPCRAACHRRRPTRYRQAFSDARGFPSSVRGRPVGVGTGPPSAATSTPLTRLSVKRWLASFLAIMKSLSNSPAFTVNCPYNGLIRTVWNDEIGDRTRANLSRRDQQRNPWRPHSTPPEVREEAKLGKRASPSSFWIAGWSPLSFDELQLVAATRPPDADNGLI